MPPSLDLGRAELTSRHGHPAAIERRPVRWPAHGDELVVGIAGGTLDSPRRDQVRYWLSRPPSERLARAEEYRVRVFGEGPYTLARTFKMLPSIVSSKVE